MIPRTELVSMKTIGTNFHPGKPLATRSCTLGRLQLFPTLTYMLR